jgi:hypothetical protein
VRREGNSSKIITSRVRSASIKAFHMVCYVLGSLDSVLQKSLTVGGEGFGVYGSYAEEHIKSAQKQVFHQFLEFFDKH